MRTFAVNYTITTYNDLIVKAKNEKAAGLRVLKIIPEAEISNVWEVKRAKRNRVHNRD